MVGIYADPLLLNKEEQKTNSILPDSTYVQNPNENNTAAN